MLRAAGAVAEIYDLCPARRSKPLLARSRHSVSGAQCFQSTEITDRRTAERLDVARIERDEIRRSERVYDRWRELWTVVEPGADYVVQLNAAASKLCTVSGEPLRRAVWRKLAETAGVQDVIPTGEIVDISNDFAG